VKSPAAGERVSLHARLGTGPLVGTFSGLASAAAIETLAWAGFEAVCIDAEHGAFGLPEVSDGIRAAGGAGAWPLVRVPAPGTIISQVLDAGAAAVMVPRVESPDDARRVVSFCRYPPLGSRGIGLGRSTRYGADLLAERAELDRRTYTIVQIESVAGAKNLGSICAVEGIDMVFVGPADLAASMDQPMWSAPHREMVKRIIVEATDRGLATGLFCTSPEQVAEYQALGARLLLLGADMTMLRAEAVRLHGAAMRGLARPH
jgi:2-keto-3-deoxy-L-rhamnonate aldolase RhmA